ncbi:hypothetical protein ACFVH9_07345 [Streptomyces hirsutus]|uniref:hypothetical protein n=1 Tax=Streptomyces hirsutus TaxID=35620 RepID=UPI003641EB5D
MSGCCGQSPIIQAPTPARVDVEALLLCDVLPDGTVVGVALVEPIYDTNSGARVSTRTVDPVTGASYTPTGTLQACQPDGCNATTTSQILCDTATDGTITHFVRATTYDCEGALLGTLDRTLDGTAYTVTGKVGVCPTSPDCESPTTPVTSVGLCLADGTPIAVTVVRDCTGATTSEGWINLSTGAWSAGAVPAGTVACGDSRSIQVSGTFCDVDDATGDVLGLVLVEYTYDDTGAIASVRLVDAVTGDTYTPTGTVTVCPAGVEQPERDVLQLCDTAADGTVTPFVRDYARDENGAIVGHSDYTLDGASYTPAGNVAPCEDSGCQGCDQLVLCDIDADGVSTAFLRTVCRDCTGAVVSTLDTALDGTTPYGVAGTVGRCCDTQVLAECTYSLPDTVTGFSLTDPAYPGCWLGTAGGASYTFGDRVSSWAGTYMSDSGSASVALFSSPDLGGAISFAAFTPALPVNPAQSAVAYTGTAVINGVTVTLTATAGNGLGIWQANNIGLYLGGDDAFRIAFSKPVRLTVGTAGFADPPSLHERFCGVTVDTVPWPAVRLADCNGVITTVDPDTREPIPDTVTLECQAEDCDTVSIQALRLCDLDPDGAPNADGLVCATPFLRHFVYACDGAATTYDTEMDGVTAYSPVRVVECGASAPSLREQVWNTVSVVQDATDPLVFTYTVANSEDPSQTGTVRMTASKAYGGGCGGTPTAPVWNGPVNFRFEPDATVLALADVLRVDAIDWDSWEDKTVAPAPSRVESDLGHSLNPGNRWHTTVNNNTGHFYFDGPPASVTMGNRNDGGGLACVAPAFGFITLVAGPPCGGVAELDHIVQPLCDSTAAGTTSFLRHWSVNNSTGLLTALGDTTLNGTTAYVPTGTVTVCGQQPDQPVLTGVRRVTGVTTLQNLKTEFPGLQSVSLTVIAGTVNVAMSSGTSQAIPAGASVTWSVADNDDSSLAAASFASVTTAADYFLVWTYKAGAAG